jgi:hypothetical protein
MKHVLTKLRQLSWDMSPMANWKLAHAGISPGTNQVNMGHLIVRAKLQLNMIILKHERSPNVSNIATRTTARKDISTNVSRPICRVKCSGS